MLERRLGPINQAVIAAGGFGTRMSTELNPDRCKSLMTFDGKTMLEWLLDGLQEGGIDKFIVATNNHSDERVKEILDSRGMPVITSVIVPDGFRSIPYQVRDKLDKRFLFACGHHPISASHVIKLRESATGSNQVISAYEGGVYENDKKHRIVAERTPGGEPIYRHVELDYIGEVLPESYFYIRNPYIIDASIAERTYRDDFRFTFSYYLFQDWQNGGSLDFVEADMPPEADYPEEYAHTVDFLSRLAISSP